MLDKRILPSPPNTDSDTSLEKGGVEKARPGSGHEYQYYFDSHDLDGVQRRLKQRHIQMIAIAGTIGTGLFLGSGRTIAIAGPLSALIAYALVGTVAYATLCSLGEMTTWAPISGTYPHFAGRWVDPALGFAVGWNHLYSMVTTIPTEISATTVLLTYWDSDLNHAVIYIAVIWVVIVAINLFGVRWFGEAEFCFAIVKLSLIVALLISGFVVDMGGGPNHERIGFRYWRNPGAMNRARFVSDLNSDRFLAWVNVLVPVAFAYQGMDIVAVAASETENPRHNIEKAIRRVFWRILVFYILGILMIGLLVAYNDHSLLQGTGTAAQSPFVIAIERAGVQVFPHIINACVFSSAFSSGNTILFGSSRILYGLALRGQAPKVFTQCTKGGLPFLAILICAIFGVLAFMTVSHGSETVFNWLVGLTTTSSFFSWLVINVTFTRFRSGMLFQGIDPKLNNYHNRSQPWIAYWAIFWLSIFILISGYSVFFRWSTSKFVTSYLNFPIFFGLYLGYKYLNKTKFWKASEMDFHTGIPTLEETENTREQPRTLLERISNAMF